MTWHIIEVLGNNISNFLPDSTDFNLDTPTYVVLKIFNILGGEEDVLINSVKDAGGYEILWNAPNKPSGVYMYVLSTNHGVETGKIMIIK